jgi:predicted nucleotide-binding protein (sugar kinase/HSP70/actin superfamily)
VDPPAGPKPLRRGEGPTGPRRRDSPERTRALEGREALVSFPHVGTVWIPLKAILQDLDLPVIVPPQTTRRTLDIGSRHSPELACIPFKLVLGNYVEALEMGATHLLGISSRFGASCRLYFFSAVHEAILRDLGHDFEIVCIDSGRRDSGGEMVRLVKRRIDKSFWEFAKAFFGTFMRKLLACEKVEKLAARTRPFELKKGQATRIMHRSLARVDRCEPHRLRRLMRSIEDEFRAAVDGDRRRDHEPLRIGILGELFVLLDPFANHDIERQLGEMGVFVKRNFWVSLKLLRTVWRWFDPEYAHAMKAAARYLGVDIGAECNVTVGDTVEYKRHGFDGIVHLMPFTCMPEIVAESVLPRVKTDTGMPVITFALDEQTSETGMRTRLEAFVDLLTRQRGYVGTA